MVDWLSPPEFVRWVLRVEHPVNEPPQLVWFLEIRGELFQDFAVVMMPQPALAKWAAMALNAARAAGKL